MNKPKLMEPADILANLENQYIIERIKTEIDYRTAESMNISGNNPEAKRVEKVHTLNQNRKFLDTQLRVIRTLISEQFTV